jgi:NADPH:quinone reductase-like Zn-dependent oxidoreductase
MKAALRSRYGPPSVLHIKQIERPVPRDDEVRVRVLAATVNRTDWGVLSGKPFVTRFFTGLWKPGIAGIGSDYAGIVDEIGVNVKSFKKGDKVMGFSGIIPCGSHAEYVCIRETKGLLHMPSNIDYDEAAASLEGAFYAFSAVLVVHPKRGQKALVNGGTGAIGSSMVQFLKYFGVHVTVVCDGQYGHLLEALGADRIIDYTTEDFTNDKEEYDFVFDAVGKSTFSKCKRLLKPDGIYTSSEGIQNVFLAVTTSFFKGKKVVFKPPTHLNERLKSIRDLTQEGHFRPLIDRKYPIEEIAAAFEYVASGAKIGNVILTMDH